MGYSGHNTTPPRSPLVIIGGTLALTGIILGALFATPQFHDALTMNEVPVEMTWQELVDNGLTDNSYVRLTGVHLDSSAPNPFGAFEDIFNGFDPNAQPDEIQRTFEAAAEKMDFGQIASTVLQPIKVCPKGLEPSDVPARIVVPQSGHGIQAAIREVEESGTLTGRFILTEGEAIEMKVMNLLLSRVQDIAEQKKDDASENEVSAAEKDGAEEDADGATYVFSSIVGTPNRTESAQWFWLSVAAIAIGLVVCGSGGPSIVCCVFLPGPSLLSLLGFPMRYGRAGKMTRVMYAGVGIGLISYGYQTMAVNAQFGQLDGDIVMSVLGFLAGSFGAAAVLGSITNAVAVRLNISLEPKSTKKNAEPEISPTAACSLEPKEEDMAVDYIDPILISEYDIEIPQSMQLIADALGELDFSDPDPIAWKEGEESRPAVIQLGCQQMVVTDVDDNEGADMMRMTSVLHDGLTIVTLSNNTRAQKDRRLGTNGMYVVATVDNPVEMLSAHLEETIGMAEKRGTAVVSIDPLETTDVALLSRRVLADIRSQYGEENCEVDGYQYGRFAFPLTPVEQVERV